MLLDLCIGIASSLIASIILGFLGNKAISKQNSIILKIYVLFLSIVVFIVSAMISVILNKEFVDRISKMTEVNTLKFYSNCVNSFVFVLFVTTLFSVGVLIAEAIDRSERRERKAGI